MGGLSLIPGSLQPSNPSTAPQCQVPPTAKGERRPGRMDKSSHPNKHALMRSENPQTHTPKSTSIINKEKCPKEVRIFCVPVFVRNLMNFFSLNFFSYPLQIWRCLHFHGVRISQWSDRLNCARGSQAFWVNHFDLPPTQDAIVANKGVFRIPY